MGQEKESSMNEFEKYWEWITERDTKGDFVRLQMLELSDIAMIEVWRMESIKPAPSTRRACV